MKLILYLKAVDLGLIILLIECVWIRIYKYLLISCLAKLYISREFILLSIANGVEYTFPYGIETMLLGNVQIRSELV